MNCRGENLFERTEASTQSQISTHRVQEVPSFTGPVAAQRYKSVGMRFGEPAPVPLQFGTTTLIHLRTMVPMSVSNVRHF